MKIAKRILPQLLDGLVGQARLHVGKVQRLPLLSRGLGVDVLLDSAGWLTLQISRSDTYPSMTEWQTIARDFPIALPKSVQPEQGRAHGRFYLVARWTPEDILPPPTQPSLFARKEET